MGVRVGLDFGTSNSGVGIYDGQTVKLLPIDQRSITPEVVKSVLYITRDQQSYIGQEAIELYYQQNVGRVRKFVQKWAGEIEFVGSEMQYVRDSFVTVDELKPGRLIQYLKTALRKNERFGMYSGTQVFEQYYTVADLIQTYLRDLKIRAETILGDKIDGVTIGRPVKFSASDERDRQSQQIIHQAAVGAGFGNVRFEFEPVAAALFFEKELDRPITALIFDFGGGTLDLAVMRLGDPERREVLASGGIDIAGSDFDREIILKRMLQFFYSEKAANSPELLELIQAIPEWSALPELSTPQNRYLIERAIEQGAAPVQMKRLLSLIYNDLAFSFYNKIESSKIALSNSGVTLIDLADKDLDIWELYTRWQFETDIGKYSRHIEAFLMDTLEKSGVDVRQVDVVVKTGGSSNIPLFTEMLRRIFGQQRVIQANAFSSVTAGLAIRAYENQTGVDRGSGEEG